MFRLIQGVVSISGPFAAAPPQAPPSVLVGVISALPSALQAQGTPLAPAGAEVEWNVHAALKSCSWTGVGRCGFTARMDVETRDQVVAQLTRIGMMAEDLSVIALATAKMSDEALADLVLEIQKRVLAMQLLGDETASMSLKGQLWPLKIGPYT